MSSENLTCPHCQKTYSDKYCLIKHINRVHPDPENETEAKHTCSSQQCTFQSRYGWELKKHIPKCLHVHYDEKFAELQVGYQQQIESIRQAHQIELDSLRETYREERLEKDKAHREELLEKDKDYREELVEKDKEIQRLLAKLEVTESHFNRMADRSTTITTTTTNNNTYNHIHHVLADGKTFLEMTSHNRIKAIVNENKEKYFWQGQMGAANLVYDHVLCVPNNDNEEESETGKDENEKRMLMICTDVSRKKCKYNNDKNEVVEDIGASHFLSKVSDPIIEVAKEWHTNVTNQLNDGKRSKTIDDLTVDGKTKQVDKALFDIMDIKNEEKNQRFVNKLCTLAKV